MIILPSLGSIGSRARIFPKGVNSSLLSRALISKTKSMIQFNTCTTCILKTLMKLAIDKYVPVSFVIFLMNIHYMAKIGFTA